MEMGCRKEKMCAPHFPRCGSSDGTEEGVIFINALGPLLSGQNQVARP